MAGPLRTSAGVTGSREPSTRPGPPARIATLVPSATWAVVALGATDLLVGVSGDASEPDIGIDLPRLTRPVLPEGGDPVAVDAEVRRRHAAGLPLYELDHQALRQARPTLVITQDACDVCAPAATEPRQVLADAGLRPEWISLDPRRLDEALVGLDLIGAAIGRLDTARLVRAGLEARLKRCRPDTSGSETPITSGAREPAGRGVVLLEWADPPVVGGYWVPDQIRAAGGRPLLVPAGEPSRRVEVEELAAADLLVVAPCGEDLSSARRQATRLARHLVGSPPLWAADGRRWWSLPGPPLVHGVEILAAILERIGPPADGQRVGRLDGALDGALDGEAVPL